MFLKPRATRTLLVTLLLPLFLMSGCATNHPRDPLEPMNRAIYQFNDGVDRVLLKPLAQGYRFIVPQFARTGVSNFFSNINDVLVALNNLLQGKVGPAVSDVGRILVNSTIGVGGLVDVATRLGLEKHNEDFGQTLGVWGIGSGPYLVLPIFGPSNVRDAVGRAVDSQGDPLRFVNNVRVRNSLWGLRLVNSRAELLDTSKILETAALDEYEFVRDAYFQRRRNLIYDGSPPREKDDEGRLNTRVHAARNESPFPSAASGDAMLAGTPWPLVAAADTPAFTVADTQAPAHVETRANVSAPQAQTERPLDNTGGGDEEPVAQAPSTTPQPPVIRVWVSTP